MLRTSARIGRPITTTWARVATIPRPPTAFSIGSIMERSTTVPISAAAVLPRSLRHPGDEPSGKTKAHHNPDGTFTNPWPSYKEYGPWDFFTKALPEWRRTPVYALPIEQPNLPAVHKPAHPLQALWIGHVTFLMQTRGWNVLTDPVFSKRASPVQFMGPARFTPPACTVADLPPVHIVLISHNHYDHLDWTSIADLVSKQEKDLAAEPARAAAAAAAGITDFVPYKGTLFVCPLRVAANLRSLGVPAHQIRELDWWDSLELHTDGTSELHVDVASSSSSGGGAAASSSSTASSVSSATADSRTYHSAVITAVPAQHQSARTAWDRNATLWCGYSFAMHHPTSSSSGSGSADSVLRWYFSGDTGYRAVPQGAQPFSPEEEGAVRCPAFTEIGARCGPFDLALLPIGAYSPRWFMSSFHASPEDAVHMHVDVKAKQSIGMHWGTFPLTDEPIEEPPVRLAAAVERRGLGKESFIALKHGQLYAPGAGIVRAGEAAAPNPGSASSNAGTAAATAAKAPTGASSMGVAAAS